MIESFHWINTGYTTGIERIAKGYGTFNKVVFPANLGLFKDSDLGYILFDTGYGSTFDQATSKFPFKLYRWITPVFYKEENGIVSQLKKLGIERNEINHIIVSHLHADHIGSLMEFPNAKIICSRKSLEVLSNSPYKLLRNGVLPDLVPKDLMERVLVLEEKDAFPFEEFSKSWDLFDGLIKAVDLPGHAKGQFGIIFKYLEQEIFLIADATWFTSTIRNMKLPAPIVSMIVDDWSAYRETIQNLNEFHSSHPDVLMIPTHCTENSYPFQIN